MRDDTVAAQMQRVDAFEAQLRRTPVTRFLRTVAPTRGFAWFYRHVGPLIDPWIQRHSQGRIFARLYGLPMLLLTTVGRRSGANRVSPLVYVRDGQGFAVVGTNFGQHHHPAWTSNLLARSDASIEIGPERIAVVAEVADDTTWERLWPRFLEVYPGYQNYLSRTGGRMPRMFVLRPVEG